MFLGLALFCFVCIFLFCCFLSFSNTWFDVFHLFYLFFCDSSYLYVAVFDIIPWFLDLSRQENFLSICAPFSAFSCPPKAVLQRFIFLLLLFLFLQQWAATACYFMLHFWWGQGCSLLFWSSFSFRCEPGPQQWGFLSIPPFSSVVRDFYFCISYGFWAQDGFSAPSLGIEYLSSAPVPLYSHTRGSRLLAKFISDW